MSLKASASTIVIAALAFAGGWVSSRLIGTESKPASESQASSCSATAPQAAQQSAPEVARAETTAPAQSNGGHAGSPLSKFVPNIPTAPNKVYGPEGDPLMDLIRDRFPDAKVIIRKANDDGTFASKETFDNGESILRSFNARGELIGEDWRQASGDEVIRTYYDGGGIKGFSLKHMDGATTYITFTQSGVFKARSDQFPNGDVLTTNYDDQGRVLEKWRKAKDGNATRVQ